MKRVTLVKLLVNNKDEALELYTKKLGFEVSEDSKLGDYRWLLVRLPDNKEFCINLDVAKTDEQKALVGRRAVGLPLFSIETDDCMSEYRALKERGVWRFTGAVRSTLTVGPDGSNMTARWESLLETGELLPQAPWETSSAHV
jgi:hypothetical protein